MPLPIPQTFASDSPAGPPKKLIVLAWMIEGVAVSVSASLAAYPLIAGGEGTIEKCLMAAPFLVIAFAELAKIPAVEAMLRLKGMVLPWVAGFAAVLICLNTFYTVSNGFERAHATKTKYIRAVEGEMHEIVSHNYAPFNAAAAKYIEKLEQPDPRIASHAFREKARGDGHVLRALGSAALLTLIGASLVVLCQQRSATAPVENNPSLPWPVPQPPSTSGGTEKVVTNYTLFTTVNMAEGIDVVTGWDFAKSTDNKPERQFCYLRTPEKFGTRNINLAHRSESGALIWQATPSAFNGFVREIDGLGEKIDYETALLKCVWFASK